MSPEVGQLLGPRKVVDHVYEDGSYDVRFIPEEGSAAAFYFERLPAHAYIREAMMRLGTWERRYAS